MLYRPEKTAWEDGFARYHQSFLSSKNSAARTGGNFIPAIKVFKHIRSLFNKPGVSFHIECFLYSLPDALFLGGPADYLAAIFRTIAAQGPEVWYGNRCMTPCGDRDIFTGSEWGVGWWEFHALISQCSGVAQSAIATYDQALATSGWQAILGETFFPATVS